MNDDYYQPDFYHFSQDSIRLAQWSSKLAPEGAKIADLCAGCGVIGIEVARSIQPEEVHFLELQKEFEPFLTSNAKEFLPSTVLVQIFISSLNNWKTENLYDLVLCNPPYYLPGHGVPSRDSAKDLTRRFSEDGWGVLIPTIQRILHPQGVAVIVVPGNATLMKVIQDFLKQSRLEMKCHEQEDCLNFLEIRQK